MPVDLGVAAFWTLALVSVLSGVAMAAVFRHCSDRAAIRKATGQVIAHLLECRLFLDEPLLVLRAQRDLLVANARLLRALLRPSLVLILPCAVLFWGLERSYRDAPLVPGRATVVTAQIAGPTIPPVALDPPPDFLVETPAIRVLHDHQLSWRLRPLRPASGDLRFVHDHGVLTERVTAGPGILRPFEYPASDPAIRSVRILYPPATVLGLPWLAWFLPISAAAALLWALR
jgi:hypothetical protein